MVAAGKGGHRREVRLSKERRDQSAMSYRLTQWHTAHLWRTSFQPAPPLALLNPTLLSGLQHSEKS